jgi:hypothetical protein
MPDQEQQMAVQAALDQFGASMRDLAPQIVGYYRALLQAGLDPPAALALTLEAHRLFWRKAFGFEPD